MHGHLLGNNVGQPLAHERIVLRLQVGDVGAHHPLQMVVVVERGFECHLLGLWQAGRLGCPITAAAV